VTGDFFLYIDFPAACGLARVAKPQAAFGVRKMPGPAVILKTLHHLRRLIEDIDTRITEAPRKMTVQQKRLANQEDLGKQAHDHVKNQALQIREKEGNVKAMQTQVKKYQKQLEEAANKKEYDTLKLEIANELALISKAEDDILALMTENEEKTAQLSNVDKQVAQAKADFAQFEKDHAEKQQQLAGEKTRALDELKTTEATLPADVKPQYDRMVAGKGTDALAGLQGRTCTACYTEITSQMMSELKREMFIQCKNCGRMLYVES
jgi:predicted  nucleic acid-binding Zn-ribbon protein